MHIQLAALLMALIHILFCRHSSTAVRGSELHIWKRWASTGRSETFHFNNSLSYGFGPTPPRLIIHVYHGGRQRGRGLPFSFFPRPSADFDLSYSTKIFLVSGSDTHVSNSQTLVRSVCVLLCNNIIPTWPQRGDLAVCHWVLLCTNKQ